MKNRSPSFPKKVIESNRERWVVYYFDTEKQKRWSRRFTSEKEAQEFFNEKNIYDQKLGVEANRISPVDKRDLVEAKNHLMFRFQTPFSHTQSLQKTWRHTA